MKLIVTQHVHSITINLRSEQQAGEWGPTSTWVPTPLCHPCHYPGVSLTWCLMSPGRSVLTTTFQNSDKTQLWGEGGGRGVTTIITCHHHWWSPGHWTLLWLVTSLTHWPVIGRDPMWQSHLMLVISSAISRPRSLPHTRSLGTVEKECNLNWIVSQIVLSKNWAEIWTHETISAVIAKQKPITIIIGSGMPLDNSKDILHFTLAINERLFDVRSVLSGNSFKFVDQNRMEVICNKWRSYQLI